METLINIGHVVVCDFCNSQEESMGGVMVGSNAVCGVCTKKSGYDKPDYIYANEINTIFDKEKTFKENVLEYRKKTTGSRDGTIMITRFNDFEEINN